MDISTLVHDVSRSPHVRLLMISGSLRPNSYNTLLLRRAQKAVPNGVEVVWFDDLADVPPFREELSGVDEAPNSIQALRELVLSADAILIATPEYNGSVPGVLKNALDWLSRPYGQGALRGKTVGVLSATTGGYGGIRAREELRKVLGRIGANVVDAEFALPKAHEQVSDDGRLSPAQEGQLASLVDAVVAESLARDRIAA
jgi:chromate reductase